MKESQFFLKTSKKAPKDAEVISHKLLTRAGFIDQTTSGIYSFLPLGWRVLQNIAGLIRRELNNIGAQEVFLPTLQPKELWQESGRWDSMKPPLFKLQDQHERDLCLGPTHEEIITDLLRQQVDSYRDLPFAWYQIQNKFRNEVRATGGILRTREFLMKDLYSFHADQKDLNLFYDKALEAYHKIFEQCGLRALVTEAETGSIGGQESHEFMALAASGEDTIFVCKKCNWAVNKEKIQKIPSKKLKCQLCNSALQKKSAIEVGHIFKLGTEYSEKMGANFTDKKGRQKPIIMGCYGIGLPRLMAAIVEIKHDNKGLIWPKKVAPFDIHLIRIKHKALSTKYKKKLKKIYKDLSENYDVLYDDRDERPGVKFAESDLIGIPIRIVVSEKTLTKDSVEVKMRNEQKTKLVEIKNLKEI